MLDEILLGYVLHAVDFEFDVVAAFDRIGHLVDRFLVDLHAVNVQTGSCE